MSTEIKTSLAPDEIQRISKIIGQNLKKFNESKIGPYEFKPFTIYITNETNEVIGGIKGDLFDIICMVQSVWVHEEERGRGLGSKAFEKLEEFAKNSKCELIQLDTTEFQAKGFYEKLGFKVVAELPKNFKGFTTYIMRKNLY